jgi:hypothetical protein
MNADEDEQGEFQPQMNVNERELQTTDKVGENL